MPPPVIDKQADTTRLRVYLDYYSQWWHIKCQYTIPLVIDIFYMYWGIQPYGQRFLKHIRLMREFELKYTSWAQISDPSGSIQIQMQTSIRGMACCGLMAKSLFYQAQDPLLLSLVSIECTCRENPLKGGPGGKLSSSWDSLSVFFVGSDLIW